MSDRTDILYACPWCEEIGNYHLCADCESTYEYDHKGEKCGQCEICAELYPDEDITVDDVKHALIRGLSELELVLHLDIPDQEKVTELGFDHIFTVCGKDDTEVFAISILKVEP